MNINAKISAAILTNVCAGMTLEQAIDSILGPGAFMKLAGEVWEAARAK